jgi:hypothetical protein
LSDAPSPDRELRRIKQWVDFGFIAAYVGLFVAARGLVGGRAGLIVAICGAVAGLADVVENIGILRVIDVDLRHTTQAMVDAIRIPSLIKWTLVWIALALLARFFLSQASAQAADRGAIQPGNLGVAAPRAPSVVRHQFESWARRAVGVANLAAALLGFYGLYDNAFLVAASLPMLAGLVGVALIYFPLRRSTT